MMGSASTRPAASSRFSVSAAPGDTCPACSSTTQRASSKLSTRDWLGGAAMQKMITEASPAAIFYILPLAATRSQPDILPLPHLKNSKYSPYKEAWHLLMPEL